MVDKIGQSCRCGECGCLLSSHNHGSLCYPCQERRMAGFLTIADLAGKSGLSEEQVKHHVGSGKLSLELEIEGRVERHEAERWLTLLGEDPDFYEVTEPDGTTWLSPKLAASYLCSPSPEAASKELRRAEHRGLLRGRKPGGKPSSALEIEKYSLFQYLNRRYNIVQPADGLVEVPLCDG